MTGAITDHLTSSKAATLDVNEKQTLFPSTSPTSCHLLRFRFPSGLSRGQKQLLLFWWKQRTGYSHLGGEGILQSYSTTAGARQFPKSATELASHDEPHATSPLHRHPHPPRGKQAGWKAAGARPQPRADPLTSLLPAASPLPSGPSASPRLCPEKHRAVPAQ